MRSTRAGYFGLITKKVLPGTVIYCACLSGMCQGQADCSHPPLPDPRKSFLDNFLNPCYMVFLPAGKSTGQWASDLEQTYALLFYRANPKYQLILLGEYPQARYFSISVDDNHLATTGWFSDARIKPLSQDYRNPYLPGELFQEDQLYALTIDLGGTEPPRNHIAPGCGMGSLNFRANVIDATKRHPGISWNGVEGLPPKLPPHDDLGPNSAGDIAVREGLRQADGGALQLSIPIVLVRDLSTGCAVPVNQVVNDSSEPPTPDQILTRSLDAGSSWMDTAQITAHNTYRDRLTPRMVYEVNAAAQSLWFRSDQYIPTSNPDTAYLLTKVSAAQVQWLTGQHGFMRIRFRLPVTPSLPCAGCTLNRSQELRYWSLSFLNADRITLATLADSRLVKDPEGYVTVVVGFGSPPPSYVTATNGYTYLDLSTIPGYAGLSLLDLRTTFPDPGFKCSVYAVAYDTTEDNSVGGFMGEYAPVVDLVSGSSLPVVAEPLQHPNSCGIVPPEAPVPHFP